MISNYVPSQWRTEIEYRLDFDRGDGGGFTFPCDENGNILTTNPAAMDNYKYCMEHPEQFKVFNHFTARKYTVRDEPHGVCHCGEHIVLYNQYYGACQCDNCGQWYNLFGQELLPPVNWEEEY